MEVVLWIWIRIGSRSGSGFAIRTRIQEGKMPHKSRKKSKNFRNAGCSLLRAEGFSCSLKEARDK
jgi:hypothetical protein